MAIFLFGIGNGPAVFMVVVALFFGDAMLTPAISVLSAVEGLGVATHVFEPFVVPITVVILIILFLAIEPEGLFRMWGNVKRYFRLWPFSY